MSMPAIDIDSMDPAERVRLIADLWDSLPDAELELSAEQRQELDVRLDELDADVAAGRELGSDWAEVRARIESRRSRR